MLAAERIAQSFGEWTHYFARVAESYVRSGRFDKNDCVQECALVLMDLIEEIDPTDPDFENRLKHRVAKRLYDMHRSECCAGRDFRKEVEFENFERIIDCDVDPFQVAAVIDLEERIAEQLTPQQRLVFGEMLRPSAKLRRASQQTHTSVVAYAKATQLTVKQCRYAVERIRAVARKLIFTEENQPCLC